MNEPGTIYSDDEIECFSDSDDEEIQEETEDNFFDDLDEPDDPNEAEQTNFGENGDKAKNGNSSSIKEYLGEQKVLDFNKIIENVRAENLNKKNGAFHDDSSDEEDLLIYEDDEEEGKPRLKVGDIKKKEIKRERKAVETKERLEKERKEIGFEDAPPFVPGITFLEMNLSSPILKAIAKMNYDMPTQIQAMAIPFALRGRDICGCAATGTGKTAAFMIPILQRLLLKPPADSATRTLVLVPTRELGVQVYEVSKQLAQYTKVTIALAVGGLSREIQIDELVTKPDIVIATPGRLIDHMHNTASFDLADIEILVVDEADRILDEFFTEQLTEIVRQCRITRQTMLFSATMTEEVKELVTVSLKRPVRIFANSNTDITQNLRQEFIRLRDNDDETRFAVLAYLLIKYFREECIVFVPMREMCHKMRIKFGLLGLKCGELHGLLKQHERLDSLEKFKKKEFGVLFATDVASRGLDIKGVKTVINFTIPPTYKIYVHRVGRTARAGFSGRSVTIAYEYGRDYGMLRKIKKFSMFPLYERSIKKKNIDGYIRKLKALEPSVEKVLQLELEESVKEVSTAVVDTVKRLRETEFVPTQSKNKRRKKDKPTDEQAQKRGKTENLSNQSSKQRPQKGKINLPHGKQGKPELEKNLSNNKKKKIKKPLNGKSSSGKSVEKKTKSNFQKELTRLDARSSKKLTLGSIKKEYKKIKPIYR